MSRPPMEFKIGDEVVLTGVNLRNNSYRHKVVKVGRTLVTIDRRYSSRFRKDTGVINDEYQYESIRPVAVWLYDVGVGADRVYLISLGLRPEYRAKEETVTLAARLLREALSLPAPPGEGEAKEGKNG